MIIKTVIINIVVSIILVLTGLYFYDQYYAVKVYSVNLKGFVQKQQELMLSGVLNEQGAKGKFDRLDQKIKSLGKNAVVITKDVVIKGVEIETE